ncbi:MAG: SpoIID/LytB domain-containing protein [Candidatus Omnitrophota bacterium]
MRPKPLFLLGVLSIILSCASLGCGKKSAPGFIESTHIVRVALISDAPQLALTINAPFQIFSLDTRQLLYTSHILWNARVNASGQGVQINEQLFPGEGIRIEPLRSPALYINKRLYRGGLDILSRPNNTLGVINRLEVDDYISGVLPNEVSPWWPIEAQKAQAIVARTYALYQAKANAAKDYDLVCTALSQVYAGRLCERSRSSRAVKLTKGKVLTYQNKIIPAFYHAACGGHTENAAELWKINIIPLRGRQCKYCTQSPYYRWRVAFSLKKIEQALEKAGIKTGKIRAINVAERNLSGRVKRIEISCAQGTVTVEGNRFRLIVGPEKIKSTNFTVKRRWWSAVLQGKGWGHGVGMCQWGAYGMSRRHYNSEQILNFYYPETKITFIGAEYETF